MVSLNELNLRILKKLDCDALDIIFTGRHVVLYTFENDIWDRAGIEGTLLLYRDRLDKTNFVILNRQKMENFVQDLSLVKNVQEENDFLMFSGSNGRVYGLWFFSNDEFMDFCRVLEGLLNINLRKPKPNVVDQLRNAMNTKQLHQRETMNSVYQKIKSFSSRQVTFYEFSGHLHELFEREDELAHELYRDFVNYCNI